MPAPGPVASLTAQGPFSTTRDRALAEDIGEVLASHPELRSLALSREVRGGVVHLRGDVPGEAQRQLLRSVLARVRGVLAVWDALRLGGEPDAPVLDVGCGGSRQWPEAVGLDLRGVPGVDVVADLERELPFPDRRFGQVFAVHVLEHVRDLCALMAEIHRILLAGGVLHVIAPRWDCVNALADPTHLRLIHPQTFKYFCVPDRGRACFRPLLVACDEASVFADLQPVVAGKAPPDAVELARFFA